MGKRPSFCYGNCNCYAYSIPSLPALPAQYADLIQHSQISSLSCKLNLISIDVNEKTTHAFPISSAQGMVAVQGKVYYRICPSHDNLAI